jgi:apolipoprotein N-acyltransferase
MKLLPHSFISREAFLVAIAGAAASFFAFANPVARFPLLVLGFPWALALLARMAQDDKEALKSGWLAGALAASASLYWIVLPVHDYGFLPWVLAVPCPMLVGAVLGLYPAVFCWLLRRVTPVLGPLAAGAFAALAWTSIEVARGWLFTGFPWLTLAEALVPWPMAIQGANAVGAFGLSGLVAACGVWLAGPAATPRIAALTLAGAIALYGAWSLGRPVEVTGRFNAAMIQGNIDQSIKWEPATLAKAIGRYATLSESVRDTNPEVLIWPETALTFYVQEPGDESARVRSFVARYGVPLVTGAPGFERRGGGADIFNRAYLFTPKGGVSFYEKEHLVPFGEYAPFGQDLPILSELMQGVGAFTPGKRTAPLVLGRLAMGMLICYESIFPGLAEKRVSDGANVLVNISNDAWFGRSAAPEQHLEMAALRAVEQNRYLLRCTNTGITALVDPKGLISNETALFAEAAVAVADVGLITQTSLYHRLYGLIEGVAAAAALLLAGWALIGAKRGRG